MIQVQSILLVTDNSGAKKVMCIRVMGSTRKRYAIIGDKVKVSVKDCLPRCKVKKGDVLNAVVVRSKKGIRRSDGSLIKFYSNAVVLFSNQWAMLGTRIFGAVTSELRRDSNFHRVISLAPLVL